MKETLTHLYFWGSIYSNWTKCSFKDNVHTYTSAEAYMMVQKAYLFNDKESVSLILKTSNPKKQKALGRLIKGFNEEAWNKHKLDIVTTGVYLKFSQNEELKAKLLATGDKILVEGSPYDRVWGVGLKWDSPEILDEKNWKGQNLLGVALMNVRDTLRKEQK